MWKPNGAIQSERIQYGLFLSFALVMIGLALVAISSVLYAVWQKVSDAVGSRELALFILVGIPLLVYLIGWIGQWIDTGSKYSRNSKRADRIPTPNVITR